MVVKIIGTVLVADFIAQSSASICRQWCETWSCAHHLVIFHLVKTTAFCHFCRAPRYRIHGTQYKTVQSWLVFKHVSTVQCSGSTFIQIQYKTKQFLYPKFSSVQYSTASRIRYIVSTVQNSIDICFVLHWYYKIQSSKSFIGVTSISNSQNCIGQSLLLELVVLRANNNVAFGGTNWTNSPPGVVVSVSVEFLQTN